jgi:hypothetical protein
MENSIKLTFQDVTFFSNSVVDDAGRVFSYNDKIYRAIWNKDVADVYKQMLSSAYMNEFYDAGLIRTKIANHIELENTFLILEHEKVFFHTTPVEFTDQMFWEAGRTICKLAHALNIRGYALKDSHPWNIMFHKGQPVFVDFTSIVKGNFDGNTWANEFYLYVLIPIFLSSKRRLKRLSVEYRRENSIGLGLTIAKHKLIRKLFSLFSGISLNPNFHTYLSNVSRWIENTPPKKTTTDIWTNYLDESDESPLNPVTEKDIFVYKALSKQKPNTVLDTATNTGYFTEMAALLGASVVAFDYEESCIDRCIDRVKQKKLNVTPVLMDFRYPTPDNDLGLSLPNSLVRFRSDVVIAMGLIHHLCLKQGFPVGLFCDLLLKYSKKGIILEYVDIEDLHVKKWNVKAPNDYNLDFVINKIKSNFKNCETHHLFTTDGLNRTFLHFYQ